MKKTQQSKPKPKAKGSPAKKRATRGPAKKIETAIQTGASHVETDKVDSNGLVRRLKDERKLAMRSLATLSLCATEYARVLIDPFAIVSNMPCVPSSYSVDTVRLRFRQNGVLTIGPQGQGWVAINPYNPSSDTRCIAYSDSTYTQTAPNAFSVTDTGVNFTTWATSPFATTIFGPANNTYRVVAGGLKITSLAPLTSVGGLVTCFKSTNNSMAISVTSTIARTLRGNSSGPVLAAEEPIVTWTPRGSPTGISDVGFSSSVNSVNGSGYTNALFIEGATAGQRFYWDASVFYEIVVSGNADLAGLASPNEIDATGQGIVANVASIMSDGVVYAKEAVGDIVASVLSKGKSSITKGLTDLAVNAINRSVGSQSHPGIPMGIPLRMEL